MQARVVAAGYAKSLPERVGRNCERGGSESHREFKPLFVAAANVIYELAHAGKLPDNLFHSTPVANRCATNLPATVALATATLDRQFRGTIEFHGSHAEISDCSQQLLPVDWFGEVVVATGIDTSLAVTFESKCRQGNDCP